MARRGGAALLSGEWLDEGVQLSGEWLDERVQLSGEWLDSRRLAASSCSIELLSFA